MKRLATVLAAVAATLALSACGEEHEVTHGETEGAYVTVGDVKYQVQISRQVTQTDPEDRAFFAGLPEEERLLSPDQEWFAIFLRAWNDSDEAHRAASNFIIEDTTGQEFEPIELDPADNPLAYQPAVLAPGGQLPLPNSTARDSTTQGALLLFRVTHASLGNRPLEFIIRHPQLPFETATVELDI